MQIINLTARIISFLLCIFVLSCGPAKKEQEAARAVLVQVSVGISRDLVALSKEADALARFIERVYLDADNILPMVDKGKYRLAENGVFYKAVDDGKSALWVSGYVPINDTIRDISYFTEAIDGELERIVKQLPEIIQAYYNDKHSVNRIYPPFDVLSQYAPKINIPEFNFYFLADETHNPEKNAVWVNEPYVDPAGRGWMISAIAPVYVHGDLAGVAGVDVTTSLITKRYTSSDYGNIILIDQRGVVVSADEYLIYLFGMPPLIDHKYLETIKSDKYRSDDYNLFKSKVKAVRKMADELLTEGGRSDASVSLRGKEYLVISKSVAPLHWNILILIED